jgi:hypothetical protein
MNRIEISQFSDLAGNGRAMAFSGIGFEAHQDNFPARTRVGKPAHSRGLRSKVRVKSPEVGLVVVSLMQFLADGLGRTKLPAVEILDAARVECCAQCGLRETFPAG